MATGHKPGDIRLLSQDRLLSQESQGLRDTTAMSAVPALRHQRASKCNELVFVRIAPAAWTIANGRACGPEAVSHRLSTPSRARAP